MTPERWLDVERVYHAARSHDAPERAAFLAAACAGDEALRREVESLLQSESAAVGFISAPAVGSDTLIGAISFVGRQLGAYAIQARIGAGGMGEVYRAHDEKLGRDVAIKILPSLFTTDAERRARFAREARLMAALNHPHIGAIYGLEEMDGTSALVMELVDGEDLSERIARGPIPLTETLTMARQIGEALEAAHDQGIIHRDLKPANIKVREDGRVKVLDFGLGKALDQGSSPHANGMSSPILSVHGTQAGIILGTPAYMSPEQAHGAALDRRTDLFAFGAVLYEMLTGQRVFPGETAAEIVAAVIRAEPDWSRLPAETPSGIRRLLQRCLQKDRHRRLQAAGDIRLEIDDAIAEPGQQNVRVVPSRARERVSWLVATLGLVAAAAVLAIPYLRAPKDVREMRVDINTPATSDPTSFALSPDGERLAYVASSGGQARLWVRPLDSTTARPLAGTEGATYPFWSPNGEALGFFAEGKLKRVDVDGGLLRTLASAPAGRGGTWNADGIIVFAFNQLSLHRVQSSGGEVIAVTRVDPPRQISHRFPQFLPDGRRFIFFVEGPPDTQGIYLGTLDSSRTQRLTVADAAGAYMPMPPGWLLFLRQGTLVARRFDRAKGELTGNPIPVADPVGLDAALFVGAFSASDTGMVAYRSSGVGRRQLAWFNRTGSPLGTLGASDESGLVAPSLSPDGGRVAAHRTLQNNTDVWIFDAARTTRVTFDSGRDLFPIWSPDGTHVAFDSNRTGHRHFYQKQSDLAGAEIPLVESPEDKVLNDWSPDGRFLLYTTPNDPITGADLWYVPLSGDRRPISFLQTAFLERAGQFSPDGNWVAYQSNESGPYEIYIRPFPGPGGPWQVSTSGGIQARWRADGRELYYIAPDARLMAASITVKGTAIEPGAPVGLFQTHIWGGGTNATQGQQYDVAPDGRFLINVASEDTTAAPITLLLNWKRK